MSIIFILIAVAAGLFVLMSAGILVMVAILAPVLLKKVIRIGKRHSRHFPRYPHRPSSYYRRSRSNTPASNSPSTH